MIKECADGHLVHRKSGVPKIILVHGGGLNGKPLHVPRAKFGYPFGIRMDFSQMDLTAARVLVTGACGTIGREMVFQLLNKYHVRELIGIDNNESELFFLEQRFANHRNAKFALADIRDLQKLNDVVQGIDIVYHTAAYKHVMLCERAPFEAVQTNILGVHNVIHAAQKNNVSRLVFTSSDKAVNPTNVMGASKLMGERLITAADSLSSHCVMASVRFGNVLGSRGSVIPIFREQIRKGGPLTITHPDMTRFIMGKTKAVELVVDTSIMTLGGEVFVTKMSALRITDLAETLIQYLAPRFGYSPSQIDTVIIGTKPGEKMYEELMTSEETPRAREIKDYFVISPALASKKTTPYPNEVPLEVTGPYHSGTAPLMRKDEIVGLLDELNLLSPVEPIETHPSERFWPDLPARQGK